MRRGIREGLVRKREARSWQFRRGREASVGN